MKEFEIDGQNGKVSLGTDSVIIKHGKKELIIPFTEINDIHIGVSKSIFSLSYIRFIRAADDTVYYKPASLPVDKNVTAVTFANNKYLSTAENIKAHISNAINRPFSPTGNYDLNVDASTDYKARLGCFLFIFIFAFCILLKACHSDNPPNNPPPVKIETNIPARISVKPSIGATREEFARAYRENARNNADCIRYNNDTYIVIFDNDRANSIIIQPLVENNHLAGTNLNDYLPSDTEILTNKTYADSMVKYSEIECYSKQFSEVYPKSGGKFGIYFNYDVKTGAFLGGSIRMLY